MDAESVREPFSVIDALGGEEAAVGYARADGPRVFRFPEDHGPHPDHRHEWWYVTGNVEDETGRHFGFQITFFRFAVAPDPPTRPSEWATRQLWMAHFAITDSEAETFHHFERLGRGALGLAGAEASPFAVWLDDWKLVGVDGGFDRFRARLAEEGVTLDLSLEALKPMVFQGDGGYSRKGPKPGNASYYYSVSRLAARGVLETPTGEHVVTGTAWLDREWGSSTLGPEQTGWDWFSIQFDDGTELMFYQLRRADGSIDPRSKGGWVDADGRHRTLTHEDVRMEVLEDWTSPDGEATYPARWRLHYPDEGLELELAPTIADQELRGDFRYWEGALRGRGTRDGMPVKAVGYGELTGYQH
ncbi:MAG: lipocalin-like domain-containing protein [Pseudomonadota bacterium]